MVYIYHLSNPKPSLDNSPNDLTSETIDKSLSVSVTKPSVGVGMVCGLAGNREILHTTAASESIARVFRKQTSKLYYAVQRTYQRINS